MHPVSRRILLVVAAVLALAGIGLPLQLNGQAPFTCEGQSWAILDDSDILVELIINNFNGAVSIDTVARDIPEGIDALAFRSTDRFLYAIDPVVHTLYRIGSNGGVVDLGRVDLDPFRTYFAGAISPDGRYYTLIGTGAYGDEALTFIDLESTDLTVTEVSMGVESDISDVAYDPYNGRLYGYDVRFRQVVRIDTRTGNLTSVGAVAEDDEPGGIYVNAFGEVRAYGTIEFGVAGSIFQLDESRNLLTVKNTGPVYLVRDIAHCAYSVEMRLAAQPRRAFPCDRIRYVYEIGNGSGRAVNDLVLQQALPEGLQFVDVEINRYGGQVSFSGGGQEVTISGLNVWSRVDSIIIIAEVGDIPSGRYKSQGRLTNLSAEMGSVRVSDDPVTLADLDSTIVLVSRTDEDTVRLSRFVCLGEAIVLDGTEYGSNFKWNTGESVGALTVTDGGSYVLTALSGCASTEVIFDVTSAKCPFTIAVDHDIIPRETFPCSEVIFRYIFENDSGAEQDNLSFNTKLPDGFEFRGLTYNPLGGTLVSAPGDTEIQIEDIGLRAENRYDTIDALVYIGDVEPRTVRSRGTLSNLPGDIGPRRITDDPATQLIDSTTMVIKGFDEDSAFIDASLCPDGNGVVLDASAFGLEYLWPDGDVSPTRTVYVSGAYPMTVFNGCESQYVEFNVQDAPGVWASFPADPLEVNLGEVATIVPEITNDGDSLFIVWSTGAGDTIDCFNCASIALEPLDALEINLFLDNGMCSVAESVRVAVDKTRRVYFPNIFSPNGDGNNDIFFVSGRGYALLKEFTVRDRWGNVVFEQLDVNTNDQSVGWDGGNQVPGVYTWYCLIEFLDGAREPYAGQVVLLR